MNKSNLKSYATQAAFQGRGHHHLVIDQIVALIDQRCALTIRRLTAHQVKDAQPGTA